MTCLPVKNNRYKSLTVPLRGEIRRVSGNVGPPTSIRPLLEGNPPLTDPKFVGADECLVRGVPGRRNGCTPTGRTSGVTGRPTTSGTRGGSPSTHSLESWGRVPDRPPPPTVLRKASYSVSLLYEGNILLEGAGVGT